MLGRIPRIWLVFTLLWGGYIFYESPSQFRASLTYLISEQTYFEWAHVQRINLTLERLREAVEQVEELESKKNPDSIEVFFIKEGLKLKADSKEIGILLGRQITVDLNKHSLKEAIQQLQNEAVSKKNLSRKAPVDIYEPLTDWLVPPAVALAIILLIAFVGLKLPTCPQSIRETYKKLSPAQQIGFPMAFVVAILAISTVLILDYNSPVKSCLRKVLSQYGESPQSMAEAQAICSPKSK